VDDLAGPLSSCASRDAADGGACGHADRTAGCADGRPRGRATACADALGEVVVGELVFWRGIGDLPRPLTS
jgi:hypothetical protein